MSTSTHATRRLSAAPSCRAPPHRVCHRLSARENPHLVRRESNLGAAACPLLELRQRVQGLRPAVSHWGRNPVKNTITASQSRLSLLVQWARESSGPGSNRPFLLQVVVRTSLLCGRSRCWQTFPAQRVACCGGRKGWPRRLHAARAPFSGAAIWDRGILLLVVIRLRQPVDVGDIDPWSGRRSAQTTWLPVLSEWLVHAPTARYFPSQARWESFTPDNIRVSILQPPLLGIALVRCVGRGIQRPIKLQHLS